MRGIAARYPVLTAAACVLAAVIVTGCAAPTIHGSGVMYTCCSESLVSAQWHPGQHMLVVWARTATVAAGHSFDPVTLTVVLTGPFTDVTALKAALSKGQLNRRAGPVTVAAPAIRISRDAPRSVVSVVTIPQDAPSGFYNLQVSDRSRGGTVSAGTIITVG